MKPTSIEQMALDQAERITRNREQYEILEWINDINSELEKLH